MRQERSIGEVGQPDLELKHHVVKRTQDAPASGLPYDPVLHRVALGDYVVYWNSNGRKHWIQGLDDSLNKKTTVFC